MNSFQKIKQRGLSLIEAAMVLALSAVVVSGVMYYMSTA
ncbi:TPA: prepilin-type N-terminal cleavage/methylation domain-containing protein, partial [Escherichia coli]|nr:prepilin-type N-terminal cleavage/methylation domain-containing protein [Escherichia coli]